MTIPLDAVPAIVEQMMKKRRRSFIIFALTLVGFAIVSGVLFANIGRMENRGVAVAMLLSVVGTVHWIALNRLYRAELTDRIMPIIAGTLGLSYNRQPPNHFSAQSEGMLPAGPRTRADDELSGEIDGQKFVATEVRIFQGDDSGAKGLLFRGYLLELHSDLDLNIMIRRELNGFAGWKRDTFGAAPAGMTKGDTMSFGGREFEFWSDPRSLPEVDPQKLIRAFAQSGSVGQSLQGIVHRRGAVSIAVDRDKNFFQMGGLAEGREAAVARVQSALSDLLDPTSLVLHWHSVVAEAKKIQNG